MFLTVSLWIEGLLFMRFPIAWHFPRKQTPCRIKGESVGLSVYLPVVARQRLGKHVPTTTKNCWKRRFLCGPCLRKQAISSSQNRAGWSSGNSPDLCSRVLVSNLGRDTGCPDRGFRRFP
jgi:hypothetical protein